MMLKFIRSKGHQQPTAERQKLQKELYAFRKVSQLVMSSVRALFYTFALRIGLISLTTLATTFLISEKFLRRGATSKQVSTKKMFSG